MKVILRICGGILAAMCLIGAAGCRESTSVLKKEDAAFQEAEAGFLSESDAETESKTESGQESGSKTGSESGQESGAKTGSESESSQESGLKTGAGSESGRESGSKTGSDSDSDEVSGTEREPGAVSGKDAASEQSPAVIYVDVCGAVKSPGVYQLLAGSRVFQAIEKAGGFLEEAESALINQADVLEDGQQIRVYTKEEAEAFAGTDPPAVSASAGLQAADASPNSTEQKVNINQADKTQLMTLTGIGETRAEAIIRYRETNGLFSSIEDLMQVEGIKEKTYEKLKDQITV